MARTEMSKRRTSTPVGARVLSTSRLSLSHHFPGARRIVNRFVPRELTLKMLLICLCLRACLSVPPSRVSVRRSGGRRRAGRGPVEATEELLPAGTAATTQHVRYFFFSPCRFFRPFSRRRLFFFCSCSVCGRLYAGLDTVSPTIALFLSQPENKATPVRRFPPHCSHETDLSPFSWWTGIDGHMIFFTFLGFLALCGSSLCSTFSCASSGEHGSARLSRSRDTLVLCFCPSKPLATWSCAAPS